MICEATISRGRNMRLAVSIGCALSIALVISACLGARSVERPPDEQFGHRYEGRAGDGRETIVITAEEESTSYVYVPAVYDTVHIRVAEPETGAAEVPVEVLIKGAFPDACTELSSVSQGRAGNLIRVELDMRRPQGVLCASVVRPYRFYLALEGTYEPGHYSLRINERTHPMVIRPFG